VEAQVTFVEVKTLFPRPSEKAQDQVAHRLCAEVEALGHPGIYGVVLYKEAPDFTPRSFKAFLRNTILPKTVFGEKFDEVYRDVSGLSALVTYAPPHKPDFLACMPTTGGWVHDSEYIRASVLEAENKFDRESPNLVVVCSQLMAPPAPEEFVSGLFQPFRIAVPGGVQTKQSLLGDQSHRRISAVAQFDTQATNGAENPFLILYHHPSPYVSLDAFAWKALTKAQYQPPGGWLA